MLPSDVMSEMFSLQNKNADMIEAEKETEMELFHEVYFIIFILLSGKN